MRNYDIQRALWDADLSPSDKFVGLCLVWHRNRTSGECRPSYATLSRLTGYSRRTVAGAVQRLESSGILRTRKTGRAMRFDFRPTGSRHGLGADTAHQTCSICTSDDSVCVDAQDRGRRRMREMGEE